MAKLQCQQHDILEQLTPLVVSYIGGNSYGAETDSEQLDILGIAFTILDEPLPSVVVKICSPKNENQEVGNKSIVPNAITTTELKDWRCLLQHAFDKLTDHFCRQYVLSFIHSREAVAVGNCGWRCAAWKRETSTKFACGSLMSSIFWGYPSWHVHQIASAITAPALPEMLKGTPPSYLVTKIAL
ncbi:hypothetical protein V6N13_097689 [Hibiscus sabdariffa]